MIDFKSILSDPSFLPNLVHGVLGSAIFALLEQLLSWGFRKQILAFSMKLRWGFRARAALTLGFGLIAAAAVFLATASILSATVAYSCVISWTLWQHFSRLSGVGLAGVDQEVEAGIDYTQALQSATNSIDFLGTGAHKLTSSPEFEHAAMRCNRMSRPLRFLLCDPDNPVLQIASVQAGLSPDTYGHRVRSSVQILAKLANDKKLNIEVRFYPLKEDLEVFRCMFLNDNICLLSYNALGKDEGRKLPQLLFKNFDETDNRSSFYYPLWDYYERLWNRSRQWRPSEFE